MAGEQCLNGTRTHQNAVLVLFWTTRTPLSAPFKTTRLMVKLHQTYVLASLYVTLFYFESVCNSLRKIWNKKLMNHSDTKMTWHNLLAVFNK